MTLPSTIARYMAGRFLIAILLTLSICALLIYMIDLVELLRIAGKRGSVPMRKLAEIAFLRLGIYVEFLFGFAVLAGSIGALLVLNRKSELAVMRAGGMSVWQILKPGMIIALLIGIVGTTIYNPLAASGRDLAEKRFAKAFGRNDNLLAAQGGGSWLRQSGIDGDTVIAAAAASNRGLTLTGVMVLSYGPDGAFQERIDAATAELREGYWKLTDVWVSPLGAAAQQYGSYMVATYLTPDKVQDALGSAVSVSFWDLPRLIEVTEKAKLSAHRLRLQYQMLLSRPALCLAMLLLAATVSLRSFRSGGIRTMVMAGLLGGFGFFLVSEISRQIGIAGLAPAWAAVWLPIVLVSLISTTVLLHQEDG